MEQFFVFLQKNPLNLVLLGVAVISGGMLVWPLVTRGLRPSSEVSPFEAVQLINRKDALVIDLRDASDFAVGHIANARNIPESQIPARLKELEKFKSKPIILSCRAGGRAGSITNLLRKQGYGEVYGLRGGIVGWQQASMPLER